LLVIYLKNCPGKFGISYNTELVKSLDEEREESVLCVYRYIAK